MRLRYDTFDPSMSRSEGPANQILSDLEDASADLDQENLAEEGFDASCLVAHPILERVYRQVDTTRTTLATTASFTTFATFAMSANLRSTALGALLDGEYLRIRTLVFFGSQVGSGSGVPSNAGVKFRHAWNNGTTTAKINCSERAHHKRNSMSTSLHAGLFVESWLAGPQANVAYVELQYATDGAAPRAERAVLTVVKFKRVGSF